MCYENVLLNQSFYLVFNLFEFSLEQLIVEKLILRISIMKCGQLLRL